jgi:hypothetical protein
MPTQQQQIIEAYIQAYNQFDIAGMMANLSEGVVFENVTNGIVDLRLEGIEAFRQQAEAATAYFSQRQQIPTNRMFEGNVVTVSIEYKAALAIDLPNGMKNGDTLTLQGTSRFEFEGEAIVLIRDES